MKNELDTASSEETQQKIATICIVQLSRIGDVLQTYQAAKAFKDSNPEVRLILVARKKFAHGLDFLLSKVFTKCFYFDFPEHKKESHQECVKSLISFFELVNAEKIDLAANFTFSKSSSHFSSMIQAKHRIGPYTNILGANIINDRWSQLVASTVMRGPFNPFNLVDVFKNALGPCRILKIAQNSVEREKRIVVHPFASHPKKQWRPNKWVEVIYRFLKDHPDFRCSIVGAQNEKVAAAEILSAPILKDFLSRIDNLVGNTSLESLYKSLRSSTLFVGHDSMTGHLASVANTQTLTVSVGTVRPNETSPYGQNNYTLAPRTKCFPCFPGDKCPAYQCHADVPHQLVNATIKSLLAKGSLSPEDIKSETSIFHLSSANIYRSDFTNQSNQTLHNISGNEEDAADLFRLFYRITFLYYFSEKEEKHDFPTISKSAKSSLSHYLGGIEHLYQLAEFGMTYCRYILEEVASKSPDLAKIREFSAKVDEIDKLQEMIVTPYPALKPLIDFFTLAKANTPGGHLVEIAENSYLLYNDYSIITKIVFDLIKSSVPDIEVANRSVKNNNIRENL